MQNKDAGKVKGIDISHYQGNVNFAQVKGNVDFIYCKASEGVTYTDPMFSTYVAQAKAQGIPVGGYHFARFDQTAPDAEANHFCDLLQANPTDLFPVLDLEAPTQRTIPTDQLIANVRTFINIVKERTGKQVILYTGIWFANIFDHFNSQLSDLPLWVSVYGDTVSDFGGWTNWTIWQFSNQGSVPGINGDVDLDVAVSLEDIGHNPPAPKVVLSTDEANYIIHRFIGRDYDFANQDDQLLRAYLADKIRVISGQEPHNTEQLKKAFENGYTPVLKLIQ